MQFIACGNKLSIFRSISLAKLALDHVDFMRLRMIPKTHVLISYVALSSIEHKAQARMSDSRIKSRRSNNRREIQIMSTFHIIGNEYIVKLMSPSDAVPTFSCCSHFNQCNISVPVLFLLAFTTKTFSKILHS